jgi:Mg-chelatase subunit ChlD
MNATVVKGRTSVMQTGPADVKAAQPSPPPIDTKTIVQRATQAFGSSPIQPHAGAAATQVRNQREDTVCVIDHSSSMAGQCDHRNTKLQAAARAYGSMIANKAMIDPNDRVGIVSFNSRAQIEMPLMVLATGKRELLTKLQSLRPNNGTDQNEGLKLAEQLFDWSLVDVVRRIMLLTDGQGGEPVATAERLKANGVVIDVIGVGKSPSGVNEHQLKKVASVIEGELRYRFIKDQQTLVQHYTSIANKTATA